MMQATLGTSWTGKKQSFPGGTSGSRRENSTLVIFSKGVEAKISICKPHRGAAASQDIACHGGFIYLFRIFTYMPFFWVPQDPWPSARKLTRLVTHSYSAVRKIEDWIKRPLESSKTIIQNFNSFYSLFQTFSLRICTWSRATEQLLV